MVPFQINIIYKIAKSRSSGHGAKLEILVKKIKVQKCDFN